MKINILPYLSEKSSDFDEILYTASDFELDERHVIKNEKVALDTHRVRVRQKVFLVSNAMYALRQWQWYNLSESKKLWSSVHIWQILID